MAHNWWFDDKTVEWWEDKEGFSLLWVSYYTKLYKEAVIDSSSVELRVGQMDMYTHHCCSWLTHNASKIFLLQHVKVCQAARGSTQCSWWGNSPPSNIPWPCRFPQAAELWVGSSWTSSAAGLWSIWSSYDIKSHTSHQHINKSKQRTINVVIHTVSLADMFLHQQEHTL